MTRRVLITRAPEECRRLQELLADCGLLVEPFPVLRFEPVESSESWERAVEALTEARLQGRVSRLLLTSPRAVGPLCEQAPRHRARAILSLPVAAVGRTTAATARKAGLRVELTGPGTGVGLGAQLTVRPGKNVLFVFPCGVDRRTELPEALRKAGHDVRELEVYRMLRLPPRVLPVPEHEIAAVVLTSPRSARYYVENLGGRPPDCLHLALGPTTRDAAGALGIECRIPARPEVEALAEELCSIWSSVPGV